MGSVQNTECSEGAPVTIPREGTDGDPFSWRPGPKSADGMV